MAELTGSDGPLSGPVAAPTRADHAMADGPGGRKTGRVRLSGSFRISAGASGRGAISAINSSTSRFVLCVARARRTSRFCEVGCGASLAIAVRWRRPSASIARRIGCSRAARPAAMRR
jgi:hypothetical protein